MVAEMLWVQIPPEPLTNITPSWSSQECSPACHAGDRRFKSDRGCFSMAVIRLMGKSASSLKATCRLPLNMKRLGTRIGIAAKLKPWCLRVRLPPASLSICVGWALAGPAGCKPVVRMDLGGSTPSRRTQNRSPWRGAMMVLQRGFQSRQRGFNSRPRH